jgi:uncharacterized protein (TIRG00374 family)
MKKKFAFVLSLTIGLVLLFWVYSKIPLEEVINVFKHASLLLIFRYIIIISLIEIFLAVRWNQILKAENIFVPFHRVIMYTQIGYAIGYLSPQAHIGGEPVKALGLKKHNVEFKKGISTVIIDKSMRIMTDAFFAIIGVLLLLTYLSISNMERVVMFTIISIPCILFIMFFFRMVKGKPTFSILFRILQLHRIKLFFQIEQELLSIENHISDFFRLHRIIFFKALFVNIILWILMFLEYKTVLLMFGYSSNLVEIFLILSLIAISYMMPVPMALGVLEAGQISVLGALGLKQTIGLATSIIVRTKDLIRSGLGLLFLSMAGIPWKKIFNNKK